MMDLSYENYVPTEKNETPVLPKEVQFANEVKALASKYGIDYLFATRNGVFNYSINNSFVLKELALKCWELNNKAENIPMNN